MLSIDLIDDENLKLLEEIKAHRSMPERDYVLIEKLFNPHNDSIILNQSEVTAIRELLLCTFFKHYVDIADVMDDNMLGNPLIKRKKGSNDGKKLKEMEKFTLELQRELTQTQEKLINEMEEKNKYMKQVNNYSIENSELKKLNAQLQTKIQDGLVMTINNKEKRKSDIRKVLETETTNEIVRANSKPQSLKGKAKKTVQINFPSK